VPPSFTQGGLYYAVFKAHLSTHQNRNHHKRAKSVHGKKIDRGAQDKAKNNGKSRIFNYNDINPKAEHSGRNGHFEENMVLVEFAHIFKINLYILHKYLEVKRKIDNDKKEKSKKSKNETK